MTDPKALTDEQIDAIVDRYAEDDQQLLYVVGRSQTRELARAIERATREQTASTGEPVGWVASNVPERFKANPNTTAYLYSNQPDDDFMPLYAAPVEQAGSPPLVNPAQPSGSEKTSPCRSGG